MRDDAGTSPVGSYFNWEFSSRNEGGALIKNQLIPVTMFHVTINKVGHRPLNYLKEPR